MGLFDAFKKKQKIHPDGLCPSCKKDLLRAQHYNSDKKPVMIEGHPCVYYVCDNCNYGVWIAKDGPYVTNDYYASGGWTEIDPW